MGCIEGSKDAEEERLKKDANKKIEKQIQKDKQIYRATHRLLLLGNDDVISQPTHFSANFEICASDKARVPSPRKEHVAQLFWASLVVFSLPPVLIIFFDPQLPHHHHLMTVPHVIYTHACILPILPSLVLFIFPRDMCACLVQYVLGKANWVGRERLRRDRNHIIIGKG